MHDMLVLKPPFLRLLFFSFFVFCLFLLYKVKNLVVCLHISNGTIKTAILLALTQSMKYVIFFLIKGQFQGLG